MIRDPLAGGALSADVSRARGLAREGGESGGQRVARGFESLLLKQLVTAMRKTVPESGLLASGPGGQMYDHLVEQSLADHLARGDALGLEALFARATGEPAPPPELGPRSGPSFRARGLEPATLTPHTRDRSTPLAATLPPQEDTWLDSPEAELKLRRLLLEGASPDEL